MERVVQDRYAESREFVMSLLEQLSDSEQTLNVKAIAEKHLSHLEEEMESINYMREANTFAMMELDNSIQCVEAEQCAFIASVLQLAKANQQNGTLQARALRTLSKIAEVYAKKPACARICQDESPEFEAFVLETMHTHRDNVSVMIDGCLAVGWYAQYAASATNFMQTKCGIHCVKNAMEAHPTDAVLQDKALFALQSIANRRVENKVLLAKSGLVERVLEAMEKHPTDDMKQRGAKLLAVLVVQNAGAVVSESLLPLPS
jgi:hypothetical protein